MLAAENATQVEFNKAIVRAFCNVAACHQAAQFEWYVDDDSAAQEFEELLRSQLHEIHPESGNGIAKAN